MVTPPTRSSSTDNSWPVLSVLDIAVSVTRDGEDSFVAEADVAGGGIVAGGAPPSHWATPPWHHGVGPPAEAELFVSSAGHLGDLSPSLLTQ
jgi:hypothetical protein